MFIRSLVISLLLLTACGAEARPAPVSGGPTTATSSPPEKKATAGRFDGLTIHLELEASSVSSGREVGSSLTVRNGSGELVVDPKCLLGSGRYALVPIEEPGAELWLQPVVDCGARLKMPDGFTDRYSGPTFPARTQYGDPLPPGDYVATLEIEGYPELLGQPIEVTE
jgi:hypothetical protein